MAEPGPCRFWNLISTYINQGGHISTSPPPTHTHTQNFFILHFLSLWFLATSKPLHSSRKWKVKISLSHIWVGGRVGGKQLLWLIHSQNGARGAFGAESAFQGHWHKLLLRNTSFPYASNFLSSSLEYINLHNIHGESEYNLQFACFEESYAESFLLQILNRPTKE